MSFEVVGRGKPADQRTDSKVVHPMPIRFVYDQRVEMRDGIHLSTDIFLPREGSSFPTVLFRTPYQSTDTRWTGPATYFASHGFAAVIQDCRGKFESEGSFYAYHNEAVDGADTLAWIRAQPWCNGRVGTYGRSYGGLFQWLMAPEVGPDLTAMAPHAISDDYYSQVA